MARTKRKLRYGRKRSFKLRENTDVIFDDIAKKKGIKWSALAREVIERWVWGHMNGPGAKQRPKPKNEKLL